jgi:hypothetical protein
MTAVILDSTANPAPIDVVYPSSDGEPWAESYDPLYVIMTILAMLLAHLKGQQATVLAVASGVQIAIFKDGRDFCPNPVHPKIL